MKKIYLAIPYTGIEEFSFFYANKIAAMLMKQGYCVYSPISHGHTLAKQSELPTEWAFWKKQDECFIKWADALYVVCLPGWKESIGVQAELGIAKKLGKTRVELDPAILPLNTKDKCLLLASLRFTVTDLSLPGLAELDPRELLALIKKPVI